MTLSRWVPGLLAVVALSLSIGCAPQLYWAKPGATQDDFDQDVSECKRSLVSQSTYPGNSDDPLTIKISDDAVEQCLMANGWILAEKP